MNQTAAFQAPYFKIKLARFGMGLVLLVLSYFYIVLILVDNFAGPIPEDSCQTGQDCRVREQVAGSEFGE